MPINYVIGDATDPNLTGIIAHICNNQGGWGAGFVLALSRRWKEPEESYRQMHHYILGEVRFVQVSENLCVANMIAQNGFKFTQNSIPLSYSALKSCLSEVRRMAKATNSKVHMPRIGCGLGGGNWDKVSAIIEEELCSQGVEVFVYDLK